MFIVFVCFFTLHSRVPTSRLMEGMYASLNLQSVNLIAKQLLPTLLGPIIVRLTAF